MATAGLAVVGAERVETVVQVAPFMPPVRCDSADARSKAIGPASVVQEAIHSQGFILLVPAVAGWAVPEALFIANLNYLGLTAPSTATGLETAESRAMPVSTAVSIFKPLRVVQMAAKVVAFLGLGR